MYCFGWVFFEFYMNGITLYHFSTFLFLSMLHLWDSSILLHTVAGYSQDYYKHRKNSEQNFLTKGNLQSSCKSNNLEGIYKWNAPTKKLYVWKLSIENGYFTLHYVIPLWTLQKYINSYVSMPPMFQNYWWWTSETLVFNKNTEVWWLLKNTQNHVIELLAVVWKTTI